MYTKHKSVRHFRAVAVLVALTMCLALVTSNLSIAAPLVDDVVSTPSPTPIPELTPTGEQDSGAQDETFIEFGPSNPDGVDLSAAFAAAPAPHALSALAAASTAPSGDLPSYDERGAREVRRAKGARKRPAPGG